jgi:hypothetical protein
VAGSLSDVPDFTRIGLAHEIRLFQFDEGRSQPTPRISDRAVAPSGITTSTAPNDHFGAGPDVTVAAARGWRSGGAGRRPSVGGRIVASVAAGTAPDDHFGAGPDGAVAAALGWRSGGGGRRPSTGAGIISPPRVEGNIWIRITVQSTPDDHFGAGPDGSVFFALGWRSGGVDRCPSISERVIAPSGFEGNIWITPSIKPAPDDHFGAGPDGSVFLARSWRSGGAGRRPSVCGRIVASVGVAQGARAAPDDHFGAGPDSAVPYARCWRVRGANRSHYMGCWIIAELGDATPYYYFRTGPDYGWFVP